MTFANFTSSRWLRALIFCVAIIPFGLATKSVGAADDPIRLQDDAPSRYTVKKGDTLWDIAGKFLRNPWQWPKIWGMNKKLIKDPHWIYPGDVIVLDRSGKFPRLTLERGGQAGPGGTATVKLSPRVRSTPLDAAAIPSIPPKAIEPFITRPLLVDKDMLAKSPVIVATEDRRFVVGEGSVAYVEGMSKEQGSNWYIYRPGNTFRDPDTDEILGYEAVHLGEARVTRFGKTDREASTIEITDSKMEINKGDRLVPVPAEDVFAYIPHAPEKSVRGRILAAHEAVSELAWGQVVAISKGSRDGLERGHVLASMRLGEQVNSILREERGVVKRRETVGLPDEPTGLVFIFRTFDRVAYGLVVRSVHPLHVGDVVQTPEQ